MTLDPLLRKRESEAQREAPGLSRCRAARAKGRVGQCRAWPMDRRIPFRTKAGSETARDRRAFIDLPYRLYRDDPHWVPPLKRETRETITPAKNGWFSHARAQLFLAEEGERVVGRISAHIDTLALTMPAEQGFGPGVGQWGLMEAEREDVFAALLARAEGWLRDQGMA